jgi:hypothetical protein
LEISNLVYEGKLKRQGKDLTKHKKAIVKADLNKMYVSGVVGDYNPISLQRKVFFELGLHFGRRGQENWRSLMKDSCVVKTDPSISMNSTKITGKIQ